MGVDREIPKGWQIVKLDDLIIKMTNGANVTQFEEKVGFPIARIETIWNESIDLSRVKYVKEDHAEFVHKYKIRNNDILFSHINSDSHLGKTAIYKMEKSVTLLHGINLLLIRPSHEISADFLNYHFKYLRLKGAFVTVAQKAVNQSSINQAKLKNFDFVLPPLPEQHRIVAKIEELFSSLDKGIESLKTAQQQLKAYRQAVLKWAFEGKLPNKNEVAGELPEGCRYMKVEEICNVVRGGSPRPAGDPKYYGGSIPFLKVADITKDNSVFLTSFKYTIKEAGLHKTRRIPPNTLLLSNSGATLGVPKICMIDATMNDGIAAFLDLDPRSNLFLYYFWLSKTSELRNINMGAAQPNLNTDILKKYMVPYCSLETQYTIVAEIESRLSVCDKIEESIEQSLKHAESLRQSILKKAFEGKLVPQDPNDLPASVLLERIKAERERNQSENPPHRQTRKARTKKAAA